VIRFVVVAGPTASGKSAVALDLAERFGGEIVNADSRQLYRYMDVGTAKPTSEERARVRHHLFDVADPDEVFDAARYRDLARAALLDIAARGRLPIVVGGTGLYVRVLRRGLFRAPPASSPLRRALQALESRTPGTLFRWCTRLDPALAERVHRNDRLRLVRALEVGLVTGEPMSRHHRRHGFEDRLGESLFWIVDPGTEALRGRIAARSAALFERGLVDEVRSLWRRGYGPRLAALRSIGYREAARVLAGERSVDEAIADLVQSTQRFAKRQRTWFRAEHDAAWVHPEADRERMAADLAAFLDPPPAL
jgi:tRNA dimethylallyltransferase